MAFDYVVVLAVGTLILAIAIGLCFAISDSKKPRNNQDAELRAARRLKNSDYAIGELEPIRVNCDL